MKFYTHKTTSISVIDAKFHKNPLFPLRDFQFFQTAVTMVTFFNSFRKGPMVCRGLDLDLSGKVANKTTLTRKRGRHAHIAWDHPIPPLSLRTKSATQHGWRCCHCLYTHKCCNNCYAFALWQLTQTYKVSYCWQTIGINDRSCQHSAAL